MPTETEPSLALTSVRLRAAGVPHGFSHRRGGVSAAPYHGLNLGLTVGDDPFAVRENLALLAAESGVDGFDQVSQVHGRRVVQVEAATDRAALAREEADALASDAPGRALAVRTADCVPLLIADPASGAVAAVHAGWRGTLEGAAEAAVRGLSQWYGAAPAALLVAIGPAIRACCYEVDPDLAGRFASALGPRTVRPHAGTRPHLDLVAANLEVLARAGVEPAQVDVLPYCTACRPDLFFSHRRDGARSGRHLSWVMRPIAG